MAGGMTGGPSGGGYRRGGFGRRHQPLAEINVTPFVDVMLVLLIVFMVTAPLLTVGVPVELPETKAAQLVDRDDPLIISVDAEGRMFLQETERTVDTLIVTLQEIKKERPQVTVYIRGDKGIPYGEVMVVMGALVEAGITKLSLVAKSPERAQ